MFVQFCQIGYGNSMFQLKWLYDFLRGYTVQPSSLQE